MLKKITFYQKSINKTIKLMVFNQLQNKFIKYDWLHSF